MCVCSSDLPVRSLLSDTVRKLKTENLSLFTLGRPTKPDLQHQSVRFHSSLNSSTLNTHSVHYRLSGVTIPRVGVRDVEPLAEQFVRMPLKCFSGHRPKHFHLDSSLFVVHVALKAHEPQIATHNVCAFNHMSSCLLLFLGNSVGFLPPGPG